MTHYKVEVRLTGSKTPFITCYMDNVCVDILIKDVVEKLRGWLDAKGLFLRRKNEYRYSLMLATVEVGMLDISIDDV